MQETGLGDDPGVRVEHVTEAVARLQRRRRREVRLDSDLVHGTLLAARLAGDDGAHHGGVVEAVHAGPLERQLVTLAQVPAAADVAASDGSLARVDDELVARVVAVTLEDCTLHGRENVAFPATRHRQPVGLDQRGIGEFAGAPHMHELGAALDGAQPGDQVGGVLQPAEAGHRRLHARVVQGGESVGVQLDTQTPALASVVGQHGAQVQRGVRVRHVVPGPHVVDGGGELRDQHIGWSRDQRHLPVRAQVQALEEAVAEAGITGQPDHALLAKHEQAVEIAARQLARDRALTAVVLGLREMQFTRRAGRFRHDALILTGGGQRRG